MELNAINDKEELKNILENSSMLKNAPNNNFVINQSNKEQISNEKIAAAGSLQSNFGLPNIYLNTDINCNDLCVHTNK